MLKINKNVCVLYFCLIPFFRPIGFCENNMFIDKFFLIWLYLALFTMLIKLFRNHYRPEKENILFIIYQIVLVLVTVFIQHNPTADLKRMYAVPILIFFFDDFFLKNYTTILKIIRNISTVFLCVGFFYDMLVVKEARTVLFMGHIQIYSQIFVLNTLVCVLLFVKEKSYINIVPIFITMVACIFADTEVANICVVLFLAFLLISKFLNKLKEGYYKNVCKILFFALMFVQAIFVLGNINNLLRNLMEYIGLDPTLNGRIFIWEQAISQSKENWFLGNGINGVNLSMAWGNTFDYMHNEFLQQFIEGGIVLLLLFICYLFFIAKSVDKIEYKSTKLWVSFSFFLLLVIMITDCGSRYFYAWIILQIIMHISKMDNITKFSSAEAECLCINSYIRK